MRRTDCAHPTSGRPHNLVLKQNSDNIGLYIVHIDPKFYDFIYYIHKVE